MTLSLIFLEDHLKIENSKNQNLENEPSEETYSYTYSARRNCFATRRRWLQLSEMLRRQVWYGAILRHVCMPQRWASPGHKTLWWSSHHIYWNWADVADLYRNLLRMFDIFGELIPYRNSDTFLCPCMKNIGTIRMLIIGVIILREFSLNYWSSFRKNFDIFTIWMLHCKSLNAP